MFKSFFKHQSTPIVKSLTIIYTLIASTSLAYIVLAADAPRANAADYVYLVNKNSKKCLHQHGGINSNGAPITQWDCINQSNVKLEKIPANNGSFFLRFAHSGKCVHLHQASNKNSVPITQWECIDQANVKWREEPLGNGYSYIRSEQTDKCLHQHGGTNKNGGAITQWDCVNQPNVQWKFVSAPSEEW